MDKLSKRYTNKTKKDDLTVITLEEGRDFQCTRERAAPDYVETDSPKRVSSGWVPIGCYVLLAYFLHGIGVMPASSMLGTCFWIMLVGYMLDMLINSVFGVMLAHNYIIELGLILFVVGLASLHVVSFYGLLAFTVIHAPFTPIVQSNFIEHARHGVII